MYDGILVALKMLQDEKAKKPNSKLMIFVLTDGENNRGNEFGDVDNLIKTLKVPICTIGYNADIKELKKLSALNEAPSINADSNDVVYELGSLFNAEM
jgi:Ca-activated chloride channel family protein